MPYITDSADMTTNNLPNYGGRICEDYAPSPISATYLPGTVLQLVAIDKQLYPNRRTVQPMPAGTTATKFAGVVASSWGGFDGSVDGSYTSTPNTAYLLRGTQFIQAVCKGASSILVDQAGSGAVTLVDGLQLVSSRNTAGYAQGVAVSTAVGAALLGVASLPSTGIGSSITAAALAQASQTATVATPASGDILNLTIQAPYTQAAPGVVQTYTWSLLLNSTTAASATTAAAAMVAYLNSQANFALYFIATNSSGVITVTVNALSSPFQVTYGSGTTLTGVFTLGISGMVANSLTFACSVTGSGGTTFTAGGANLASGTGYLGIVPAFIYGEF